MNNATCFHNYVLVSVWYAVTFVMFKILYKTKVVKTSFFKLTVYILLLSTAILSSNTENTDNTDRVTSNSDILSYYKPQTDVFSSLCIDSGTLSKTYQITINENAPKSFPYFYDNLFLTQSR